MVKGSNSNTNIRPPGQRGGAWEGLCFRNLSNRTGSNVYKLKEEKFRLALERNYCEGDDILIFFIVRVNRLPREVVGAPTLAVFKARLEKALNNLV